MKRLPRTRASTRKRHLAIHEAAHAVVAMVLGLGVWKVSLREGCFTGFARVPQPRWWHARNAVASLAGDIAERRVAPDLVLLAGQDGINARAFLRRAYGRAGVTTRLHRAQQRARRLVFGNWLAIERVAARLQRTGTLDGRAVRACIEG